MATHDRTPVQMIATPDEPRTAQGQGKHAAQPALLHHRLRGDGPHRRVEPMRAEWDAMMAEYEGDNNHDHFQRTRVRAGARSFSQLPPELRRSSWTS
jgi:hypothetical protein